MIKKLFNNKTLNRLLLLEITAYPGLYKIVMLFLIKYFFNPVVLGGFVNDTAYNTIFGFFTCVNFTNYVTKDIPVLPVPETKQFLNLVLKQATFYSLIFSIAGLMLSRFGFIVDGFGFFLYMIFNSLYSILRYFYIIEKQYLKLFTIELLLLVVSVFALYFFPAKYVLLGNALCYLAFVIAVAIDLKLYLYLSIPAHLKNITTTKLTLNYALINVTASGLYIALSPLSYQLLSPVYTALIGLVSNVMQVLLIFTRSLAYHYSPLLSRNKFSAFALANFQRKFKHALYAFLGFGFTLCIISVLVLAKYFSHGNDLLSLSGAFLITVLFLATLTTSQASLASSSLLVILDRAALILQPNIVQTILFAAFAALLFVTPFIEPVTKFEFLLGLLIITNIYKFYFLKKAEVRLLAYSSAVLN